MDNDFELGFKQGQSHMKQIMLEKIEDIKKEIDNLDTYTVYTGAGQPDKCCVEFKEVQKIINKHMSKRK